MNKTLILNHKINKQAEGTYYTVPFAVPDGVECITVSYKYNKHSGKVNKSDRSSRIKNVVDLGMMDHNGRFLGWSGSSRSIISVGKHSSTKGYIMTDILPGDWFIIVGAYKIPNEGLDVRYEIEFASDQPGWLTGDIHMHSDASDGQHDITTLAKKAIKTGLDFIAVTNHNNYTDNLNLPVVSGLTLLPAVEWTLYNGHFNFYGITSPFENSFIANNEEEMLALINSVRDKGALISVNHPKCNICPYIWENVDCFDMVEVWNGPMRRVNMNAISWWHDMLQSGRKIPIVGGSDYHSDFHPVRFAHPVLRVFSKSTATNDILSAISQGHSYITSSVRGSVLGLRCDDAMMGDAVEWRDGLEFSVAAERVRFGSKLKLVTSEGIVAEWKQFSCGNIRASVKVTDTWRFAYLVLSKKIFGWEYTCAITNPIYIVHK